MAPVTILAASIYIFSSSSSWYFVKLHQTTSAYSNVGLIKDVYIISNDFLFRWNLSVLIIWIRCHAFDVIKCICLCQLPLLSNVIPKCLWLSTLVSVSLFMIRGWWTGLLNLRLREKSIDSVFLRLNKTSHLSAHEDIFARSWLRVFDALSGESTIIYRLVSSAKRRIVDWMSLQCHLYKWEIKVVPL